VRRVKLEKLFAVFWLFQSLLWAGFWSPMSLKKLQEEADVIVVATLEGVTPVATTLAKADLRVSSTVKGRVSGTIVTVEFVPSEAMSRPAKAPENVIPKNLSRAPGLWFLKEAGGAYRILPICGGDYSWADASLPVPESGIPPVRSVIADLSPDNSSNTISRTVLAAVVNWYMGLPSPTFSDALQFLSHIDPKNSEDALAVANTLTASPSKGHHITGLIMGLRLNSDEAVSRLAEDAASLRDDGLFPFLVKTLKSNYQPNGESSIRPLEKLIAAHSKAPGLDEAAGSALQKIGTKAVLPVMLQLFESEDQTAWLRAGWFFAYFALFANADGVIPGTGVIGPYAQGTRAYMPSQDSTKKPEEYAAFWKTWWERNKASLGFTTP